MIKLGSYTPSERSGIIIDSAGIAPTITTGNHGNHPAILIKNSTSKGYLEAYDGDGVNISSRMDKGQRGNVQGGVFTYDKNPDRRGGGGI